MAIDPARVIKGHKWCRPSARSVRREAAARGIRGADSRPIDEVYCELRNETESRNQGQTRKGEPMRKMMLLTKAIQKQLPALYAQDGKGYGATAYVKLFTPDSSFTWYLTEYDPKSNEAFGLTYNDAMGDQCPEGEWGYVSLAEIGEVTGPMGLYVERDKCFEPCTVREAMRADGHPVSDGSPEAAESDAPGTQATSGATPEPIDAVIDRIRAKVNAAPGTQAAPEPAPVAELCGVIDVTR